MPETEIWMVWAALALLAVAGRRFDG